MYSSSVYAWNVSGTGTTPSSNTGPSSAYSGTKYFYTEASYGATDANAELLTPLVDVTPLNVPALEFYYHMYGSSQGDLYIEVSDGTTWTIVDSIIGEQQTTATDPWLKKMIPLQGYTGTIQVKFRSVKKASFYGDMAIDDIGIVEAPLACAGIPVAGIVSTVSSICPPTSFDLEGNEIAALGITYQWQQSPAGLNTWTNLTGATNFDYAVSAGIMVATDFRLIVTCTNSNLSDTSNVVSVTLLPGLNCHCTPIYTIGCNNGAQVGGVTTTLGLTNISNTGTGCTQLDGLGFTDYSATHSASAAHSNMIDIKVDVANYAGGVKIWVDWNQNGVFEATELVGASATTVATGAFYQTSFMVPSTAMVGATKMRVRVVENSTTFDACSSASYGEAEDYEFEVIQGTPCTGIPNVDTIQGPSSICPSTAFALNLDPVLETGITYVWQSSPLGLNNWTTIAGVNSANYTNVAGITNAMDYRVVVTCTNSNLSDTTDVHSVTIAPVTSCYCEPSYTYGCSSDNINNFILVGEIAPGINNLNTPCPPAGYHDYSPTMSASLLPGNTYSGNVTTNYSSASENVRIWIDYNQNGIFEASETVATLANLSSSSTGAFTFTVPPTTTGGTYKMRVRLVYGMTPLSIDPCTLESFGETHDYTILIDGLCTDPIVYLGADTTICAGESITLDADNAGLDFEWNDASIGQTLEVSTSGTYYVTVTDGDCSTTDTIVVTVQDLPIVDLGTDVSICEGASITLDAGNAGADYLWNDNSTNQTLVVTDEGTYSVMVTEGTCFASDTVEVSYLDGPSADGIIANEQNDCFFTFSVDNAQNVNYYEWDFGDGSPATIGAAVNHNYNTNGAFIVTLTMANDCEDTLSITHEVVCDGIGIQDVIADKNAITLYPNPTTDLVTIESQNNLSMEQVTVYNVLGQIVYQNVPMSQFKHAVDVSKMASGVYTIHVQTNNGVIIRKFEIIK